VSRPNGSGPGVQHGLGTREWCLQRQLDPDSFSLSWIDAGCELLHELLIEIKNLLNRPGSLHRDRDPPISGILWIGFNCRVGNVLDPCCSCKVLGQPNGFLQLGGHSRMPGAAYQDFASQFSLFQHPTKLRAVVDLVKAGHFRGCPHFGQA